MTDEIALPSKHPQVIIDSMEHNFQTMLWLFQRVIDRLLIDPEKVAPDAEEAVRKLQKASQTLIDAQVKVLDGKQKLGAHFPDDTFDMEAARQQIEGILDRIRAARDTQELSGGA